MYIYIYIIIIIIIIIISIIVYVYIQQYIYIYIYIYVRVAPCSGTLPSRVPPLPRPAHPGRLSGAAARQIRFFRIPAADRRFKIQRFHRLRMRDVHTLLHLICRRLSPSFAQSQLTSERLPSGALPRGGQRVTGSETGVRKGVTGKAGRKLSLLANSGGSWHEKLTLLVVNDLGVFSTLHVFGETCACSPHHRHKQMAHAGWAITRWMS